MRLVESEMNSVEIWRANYMEFSLIIFKNFDEKNSFNNIT